MAGRDPKNGSNKSSVNEAEERELDELMKLMDRVWHLIEEGKLDEAEVEGKKALAADPEAPEGHTLLGMIAAQRNDIPGALAFYKKAAELDPEYIEPLLLAAELHMALDQPDEAVGLCELAIEAAEDEEDFLDALLLKVEAHLAQQDDEAAEEALAELPAVDLPDPSYHTRAGTAWIDLGDLDAAEKHLETALRLDAKFTDAIHALGVVYDERGETQKMVKAFLAVREEDLKREAPAWGVSKERFEEIATATLAELPAKIRDLLGNVPIHTSDYPAKEIVAEGNDPRMMGFFSGIPLPEKGSVGGAPSLDCVFLYQRNIERVCQTRAEVEEEIRTTIFHEAGHFFGLDEDELEKMGLG